ncbi:MAG: hypothetical protein COB02_08225 [Candidatus Cloacimonadota bacterium]|nr:MAG: hypothetical protein COB02_08225 [Candidatus Cloacimonadota bacterium]
MIDTINDMIESWELFEHSYYAGFLSAFCLALLGLIIVGKNKDFIGASLSQVSLMSIAFILSIEDYMHDFTDAFLESLILQYGFSIIVSILFSYFILEVFNRSSQKSHLSSIVYLFGASLAVLFVVNNPHGTEEIHQLNSSSLIGANISDVYLLLIILIVELFVFIKFHHKIYLFLIDPIMASTIGFSSKKMNLFLSILIGLVIGVCLKVVGFLFCFSYSLIPALCTIQVIKSMGYFQLFSLLFAFVSLVFSFFFSVHWDVPFTQLAVFFILLQYLSVFILKRFDIV